MSTRFRSGSISLLMLMFTGVVVTAPGCANEPPSLDGDRSNPFDRTEPDATPESVPVLDAGSDAGAEPDPSPSLEPEGIGTQVEPGDACATFLACITALDPEILTADVMEAFGPGGTCWISGPQVAQQCEAQCATELSTIQDIADIVPECAFGDEDLSDGGSDAGPLDDGGEAQVSDAGDNQPGGNDGDPDSTPTDAGVMGDGG